MAKMKKLQDYLKGVCPIYADLNYDERQDWERELNKEGVSIFTEFRRHELNEQDKRVNYVYWCEHCQQEHIKTVDIEEDFLYIGSCPSDENPFDRFTSRQTCQALITQLRNMFGREPEGAQLLAKYERGSDGYEVVCSYNTGLPLSMAYAYMLEAELPLRWSRSALEYLAKFVD